MRTTVSLVGAVALLLGPSLASASVIVSLNNPGSTTLQEVWVEPGETFTMAVRLSTPDALYEVGALVRASTSDVFEVVGRVNNAPWHEGTSGQGPLVTSGNNWAHSCGSGRILWHPLRCVLMGRGGGEPWLWQA